MRRNCGPCSRAWSSTWVGFTRLSGAILAGLLLMTGCGGDPGDRQAAPAKGPLAQRRATAEGAIRVTATTGMVADLARAVGGSRVRVEALMGSGVDPHLYKATQGDLEKLSGAELIFYNGLHLEGKMTEIFEQMARTRPTIAVAGGIPDAELRTPPEFKGNHDPHVWFDVSLWTKAAGQSRDALIRYDPTHAAEYQANASHYQARLDTLHTWCREQIATIPRERRVLVTAHDAFGYFGRAYDIEVIGLQGISTVAEYGLQDLTRLVDLIVARKIPAVFVESSVPKKSIEALVQGAAERGHTVRIGGQLFSDAMGAAGTPEGNYEGMVRHNVRTIVEALR